MFGWFLIIGLLIAFFKALPGAFRETGRRISKKARKVKRGTDLFKDEFDEFWGKTNL